MSGLIPLKVVACGLFVTCVVLSSSVAEAAIHYTSGIDCVPWYYEPGVVHYGENGRVANQSSSSHMTLTCPIRATFSWEEYDTVWAWVRDDHPTYNVTCSAYRQLSNGNARTWYSMGATNSDDALFRRLQSPTKLFGGTSGGHRYYSYMVCRLPPESAGTSAIAMYYQH